MASTASTPLKEIDGNTGKTVAADLDRKGATDCIPLSENVQEPVKGEKGVQETVSKKAVVKKTDLATPVTPGVTELPIAAGLRVGAREGGRGKEAGGREKGRDPVAARRAIRITRAPALFALPYRSGFSIPFI